MKKLLILFRLVLFYLPIAIFHVIFYPDNYVINKLDVDGKESVLRLCKCHQKLKYCFTRKDLIPSYFNRLTAVCVIIVGHVKFNERWYFKKIETNKPKNTYVTYGESSNIIYT